MVIEIGRLEFCGPIASLEELEDAPGLFVVFKGESLVDVLQAHSVRATVKELALFCDNDPDSAGRTLAVLYTPGIDETQRRLICEDIVRIPC